MTDGGLPTAYTWSLVHDPSREEVGALRQQLIAYNVAQSSIDEGQRLAAFVHDREGQLVAGVAGWIWGQCLEIQYLWVQATLRGQGYGRRLLQAIEEEARAQGCRVAVLDTYSFQAPAFYQKLGYEVLGVIEGYPQGCRKFFLTKRLQS